MYEPILDTLQIIKAPGDEYDSKSKTEAEGLFVTLTSSSFIVAFAAHYHLFGHTKQLSLMLQGTLVFSGLTFAHTNYFQF